MVGGLALITLIHQAGRKTQVTFYWRNLRRVRYQNRTRKNSVEWAMSVMSARR